MMLGSSTGAPHLCTSVISKQPKTGSGQWSKILVVSLQNSRHSGNVCWGIIWEFWKKKNREGVFNLYPILIFQNLVVSLEQNTLFVLNPCESRASCLWASDAVWTHRFLTCHKAIHTVGCFKSAGTGSFWMPAFEESPHWVALEPGIWECGLARTCASGSCRAAPEASQIQLPIIPSGRMEEAGKPLSGWNLRIWEPAPLKLSPLCSWAAVVGSCEAAGAQKDEPASMGATCRATRCLQPTCCLPGCSAPFWGDLSQHWTTEELRFVFTQAPFQHEGVMPETGECDSPVCPVMESEELEIYLDVIRS